MRLLPHLPLVVLFSTAVHAAPPIPFADFEGPDYAPWTVEGDAFGSAPAKGALSGQMAVEGYAGKGLVNSFNGGDDRVGRLKSPVFQVQRKFITFLIGGGGFAGETCMNLLVDGKTVRTATGTNTSPGGTERLEPFAWDVAEFAGKEARIEIIDQARGGWGHINVDQLVQADERGAIPLFVPPAPKVEVTRTLKVDANFLKLPLLKRNDAGKRGVERLKVELDGKMVRYMHVEIAAKDQKPDFNYWYDLRDLRGKEITFRFKTSDPEALNRLTLTNDEVIDPQAYAGPNRPQFHFSPRIGWMNDVNGSYYQDGLYHLFYQANPTTTAWSTGFDMHWGHSVSKDLVHWEEWPIAVYPDAAGQCYSGTAVMMQHHVPGLNDGAKLPTPGIFIAATSPFSQHLAASVDGGRSWKRYPGNPVIPNMGDGDRDPKVVWHEPSKHYVMVLYVGGPDTYRILRSPDLVKWEQTSVLPNWFECPEFIPVKSPVTGEELWMLYGCYRNGNAEKGEVFRSESCYQLGRFDGKVFTPVSKIKHAHEGPNYYAALTFVNAPNNRQVMMGWARETRFPGEPFNQCASVPLEMIVRGIGGEDVLCFEPAVELNALRGQSVVQVKNATIREAQTKISDRTIAKETPLDVTIRFAEKLTAPVNVRIRAIEFTFDPASNQLTLKREGKQVSSTTLHPSGAMSARFLIDRGIVEAFWNQGEGAYTVASLHTDSGAAFEFEGGGSVEELAIYPMAGIWKK